MLQFSVFTSYMDTNKSWNLEKVWRPSGQAHDENGWNDPEESYLSLKQNKRGAKMVYSYLLIFNN